MAKAALDLVLTGAAINDFARIARTLTELAQMAMVSRTSWNGT